VAPGASAEDDGLHSTWAITGARIVTMAGPDIDGGTVVIRDGLFTAVGDATVEVPADAETIDGTGLTLYPGLIDALGDGILKMPERKPAGRKPSSEYTDAEKGITPEFHAWEYAQLGKATLSKHHAAGIAAVQAMPSYGLVPGQAAVLCLSTEEKTEALLERDSALGLTFSPGPGYPNSLIGVMAFIRQEMMDVSYYAMHNHRWESEPVGLRRPVFNPKYELLKQAADGKQSVIFVCNNQNDIRRALRLSEELELDMIIADQGGEAFRVIEEIKAAQAKLLVSVTFKAPGSAVWSQQTDADRKKAEEELYPKNAKILADAGIEFAFASLGSGGPKEFVENVGKAVQAGLAQERAVRAMTVDAASLLGVNDVLGTLEVGKIANLVVAEGELFTEEAKLKFVFADGKRFEVKDPKLAEGDAPTVNVSGRWEIKMEGGMAAGQTSLATFTQEESSLSGSMNMMDRQVEFSEGTVAGNEIAFEMALSFGSRSFDLFFTGTVEGDTIRGSITTPMGAIPYSAKRIP
ncbi:MAG: amidohydrolase family protein, partial [bacterium]|nr:amidohydrolase family protein [bacterium]